MPIYAGKICDMRTLLKCAKNVANAYLHKTDMPNKQITDCYHDRATNEPVA